MGMKIDRKCSRCRRDDSIPVESVTKAAELEKDIKEQAAALATLKACAEKIPVGHRPALFVVMGGVIIAHEHLCIGGEGRSCAKRVNDLIGALAEFDERKPRTKKEKAEEKKDEKKK